VAQPTLLKARYRFSSMHTLEGATVRVEQPLTLVDRPDLTVTIGPHGDVFPLELDEGRAVAMLFFSNLKAINAITGTDVAMLMRDIRTARNKVIRADDHLLMVHTTRDIDLEVDPTNPPFDLVGWTVGATIPTSSNVLDGHGGVFGQVVSAISLGIERPLRSRLIDHGLFVFDTDGRRFLNVTMNFSANRVVGIAAQSFAGFGEYLSRLEARPDLTKIVAIDAQSSESTDRMRAWLLAWTALEMFIHTRFQTYKGDFDRHVRSASTMSDPLVDDHFKYVASVLEGKMTLLAKFRIIASRLCPQTAINDVKLFTELKKQRDHVTHGREVLDRDLRTPDIQTLCRRYLAADLSHER
jgi:hypothetical protein